MSPNIWENVPQLASPDGGLAAAIHGGGSLILGLLETFDRICGQFATALQHAEHEHLFLVAALVGTITLVFPTRQ